MLFASPWDVTFPFVRPILPWNDVTIQKATANAQLFPVNIIAHLYNILLSLLRLAESVGMATCLEKSLSYNCLLFAANSAEFLPPHL